MKKTVLYILLFFAGFAVSAQNTAPMSHADSLYNAIEQVGILHNEGLDTVIQRMEIEKIKLCEEYGVASLKNLPDSVKSSVKEYFKSFQNDVILNFMKAKFPDSSLPDTDLQQVFQQATRMNVLSQQEQKEWRMNNLTPFQQEYYEKIKNVMEENSHSEALLDSKLREIEKEIKEKAPSPEEAALILAGAVTARYSNQYWRANVTKWARAMNAPVGEERLPGAYPVSGEPAKYLLISPQYEYKTCDCPEGTVFDEKTRSCRTKELIDRQSNK
ncbi:MAG: hypothetical protein LBS52_02845 [Dysgonamonadaceae bacterium]|jgi:hypothetical protein|nr:hypothetical protein [Dysgonamonadaceae bacterium]